VPSRQARRRRQGADVAALVDKLKNEAKVI
jgi:hypothetical protein